MTARFIVLHRAAWKPNGATEAVPCGVNVAEIQTVEPGHPRGAKITLAGRAGEVNVEETFDEVLALFTDMGAHFPKRKSGAKAARPEPTPIPGDGRKVA